MIRIAKLDDLPAIVAIYNEAVQSRFETADTTVVSVESRRDWWNEHQHGCHLVFVWEDAGEVKGWCSLSPYRRGRTALRFTTEISYYIRSDSRRAGIASGLIRHSLDACTSLQLKNVIAIVLERNMPSCNLLEKLGFEKWGFLPRVADFDGQECGHVYYGRRVHESTIVP